MASRNLRRTRRAGSGRKREEAKRQRYWNWTQSGITVDELARHRRKRPPPTEDQKDSLKLLEGSFSHLKTEYRRRYRRNSVLKSLEKLKPEDILRLGGELTGSSEYHNEFVEQPISKTQLARRPTSLELGSVEDKPDGENPKSEGSLSANVSEGHEQFVEHPLTKRPELTRKPTTLKLEGPFESSTEVGEKFVPHPPQPVEKPIIPEQVFSSAAIQMAHEVPTEYRPEYKENYVDFGAKRDIQKRPEGHLKPEGEVGSTTEQESQYKDFHPSRPVLHRNNSLLKTSGEFISNTEQGSEYKDFHPTRPMIHRNNSLLKPSGEFEGTSEKVSEYRDFHPGRPVIRRNNSQLKPSGDVGKTTEAREEYKNFTPKRPVIHRVDSQLKPEGEMARTTEVKSEYRDFHPSRPIIHRTASNLAPEGQMENETEIRAEYRNYHPSRPVIYRKNSQLKPEGGMESATEARSEFKDFHPSRPTIHRNNSLLKPEGEIGKVSEGRSEFKDFHPSRPIIHRKNSMLHPEGDVSNETELRSEYKNFHPSRPTIHRNNSLLHPEGDFPNTDSELKSEYRDHKPKRPTIYTEHGNLRPGNRIEERSRVLTPKKGEMYVLEGEITIRPDRSGGRALESIKIEERSSTAGRRVPGTSTLPRSRTARGLLSDDDTRPAGQFRFTVENVDDVTARDKAFVVLADEVNNNSKSANGNNRSSSIEDLPEFRNRWLRGSLRDRAEPWRPSWALNPNTKDVENT